MLTLMLFIVSGELSTSATTTAQVLKKMDDLFDSVNAYTPDRRRGKPLATNIQNSTGHMELFSQMKRFFKEMKFLGCRTPPPSQQGWIWTINGIERVWKNLTKKHKNIKSLATRRLQQDPLENLFGCIRGNCGSNANPTAGQFVAGLKTAVLSNLSHIVIGNCENDENAVMISNFKTLIAPDIGTSNITEMEREIQQNINYSYSDNLSEGNDGEIDACAYVCGFILKNIPNKKCQVCKQILLAETELPENTFTEFKEYNENKNP